MIHDIGHNFPGHPFERVIKKLFPENYKSHEEWGLEIIKKSNIYNILNSYKKGFADKVLEIMYENKLDNNIWQQVHCGNLNVDTLDYLMRDQSRIKYSYDSSLARRIIENIKFDKLSDGRPILKLFDGSAMDYIKMLEIRGQMYKDIYFGGKSAAAEAFLPQLFEKINTELNSNKKKIKSIYNPFIKFIESLGTDYESYLDLTESNFNTMVSNLYELDIPNLSEILNCYRNISQSFSTEILDDIYHDDKNKIEEFKKETEINGGIFNDLIIPLYSKKKPEVYIGSRKFSEKFELIADKKVRIISGMRMGR